ncbi:hypothetical protein BLNAU_7167 [Blattamonas nauphoetae]|uniref:Uncharacterized protein n=1 Tax=Blattamonas nauphoetae TaxID=2049346 RepID=A0ABQ9Y2L7_9EUKA|nr:hypothetical protein BLNAU_7167 [Blattamonas nauphoetae]
MATVVFNFVLSPVMKYTVVPSYNLNTPPKMTFIVITFLLLRAAIAYVYKSIERKAAEKDDTNKNILKRDARLPPQIEKSVILSSPTLCP